MHDLDYFNSLSLQDQENLFGRTKDDSTKLPVQVPTSHLSHVELHEGATADESTPKRGEMVRRSTPYAFHDGTIGLYFMGFCREQAPMRERMEAIYGNNGHVRDALDRLLDAGVGVVLFRALGRDVGRRPRVKAVASGAWPGVPSTAMRGIPAGNDFDGWVRQLAIAHTRQLAKRHLMVSGPPALPAVRRGLQHPKAIVRRLCVAILDHLLDEESVPDLVAALDDDDPTVRAGTPRARL